MYIANLIMAQRKIAFALCVFRIMSIKLLANLETLAISAERGRDIGRRLSQKNVSNFVLTDRDVALPLYVIWILFRNGLKDCEAALVGSERLLESTSCGERIPYLAVTQ